MELKINIANDPDMDVNTKEDLYKEIDDIEKEITEELEKALTDRFCRKLSHS